MSLQIRTKLQKSIKEVLNCCKLQVVFKSPKNSIIVFASKALFPKFLHQILGLCNEFYCGECVSYLALRSSEQTGVSPLSNKTEQPRKIGAVCDHFVK